MSGLARNPDQGTSTAGDYCDYKTQPKNGIIIDSKRNHSNNSPSSRSSMVSETKKILQLSTGIFPFSTSTASGNKKKGFVGETPAFEIFASPSYNASSQFIFREWEQLRTLIEETLIKVGDGAVTSIRHSSSCQQKLHKTNHLFSGARQEDESLHITMGVFNAKKTPMDSSRPILKELVQQKKAECLTLQQRVESQNAEISQLQASVDDLRESKKQQISNERRLRATLKRACDDAMLARYDDVGNKPPYLLSLT